MNLFNIKSTLVLLLLVLIGCKNKPTENTINSNNIGTLEVESEKAYVREYPTDGEIIFELNKGQICEVLKKDKKEIINGKSDYWYKVKCQEKEGWIFGSQTSLKEKPKEYSIPKQVKINQNLDFGMCKGNLGCLIEEFYPIGWSEDKYFAFFVQPKNEAIGGYDLHLIIQNMNNDKIEWRWNYNEYIKKNWDEKTREDFVTIWNNNSILFNQKLNEYGITQVLDEEIMSSFPLKANDKTYTARIEKLGRENRDFGIYEIGRESVIINGEGLGSKVIFDQAYGGYNFLLNTKIIGGIISPNQERIAVIKINEKRGWEGPPNLLSVQIIGCHLEKGF